MNGHKKMIFKWVVTLAMSLPCVLLRAGEESWIALSPLPEPNGGFIGLAEPDSIVVLGGTNWVDGSKRWLRTVHRLNLTTLSWTTLAPLGQPLAYGVGVADAAGLIIVGGTTGTAAFEGRVRVVGTQVTEDPAHGLAHPAVLAAGGRINDELVLIGGTDDPANMQGFHRQAVAWKIPTGTWRTLADYPGSALGLAAAVSVADELFVFGGCRWDGPTQTVINLTDAYAYSPRNNRWRPLAGLPLAVRGHAAVALDERFIYLAGGYQNSEKGFLDAAFIYDIHEDRYARATQLPYRANVGLVRASGYVYCLGGEDKLRHRTGSCYRIKVEDLRPLSR
jgi:N-acetylneuraminic acid mutarotase